MSTYSGVSWRLIEDGAASGPFNMGLDEALLHSAAREGIATLRFYSWDGPWLSLGYAQRHFEPEKMEACERAGVGVVRRTTGGRAVLHGQDLTYSLAAPESMLRPGLRNSYDQIATALLGAIRSLGASRAIRVPARKGAAPSKHFDCFAQPAGDEIVVGPHKLVGSAQRRREGAVLQHGSIRMAADSPAAARASGIDPSVSVSLSELGIETHSEALRGALLDAFIRVLDTERLAPGKPSDREIEQARARVAQHQSDSLSAPSSRSV